MTAAPNSRWDFQTLIKFDISCKCLSLQLKHCQKFNYYWQDKQSVLLCGVLRYLYEFSGPAHWAGWFCWLQLFWEHVQHRVRPGSLPCGYSSSATHRQPAGSGTAPVNNSSWLLKCRNCQLAAVGAFVHFSLLFFFFSSKPNLSSDSLPQPSSSNSRPAQARLVPGCSEYQASSITSGAMLYGQQSYPDPPVSIAYTPNTEQPASSSVPFLYPLPCHKFSHCTTIGMTPTVITHTASTMGAQGSVHQAHGYPHTGDTYSQTPCHSLSYPDMSDPVHAALPPVTVAHCFSVPEQMAVTGIRGKHKQKTGGLRTAGSSGAQTAPLPSIYEPTPTSCLAKLLSSGSRERESVVSFFFSVANQSFFHQENKLVGSCFCVKK